MAVLEATPLRAGLVVVKFLEDDDERARGARVAGHAEIRDVKATRLRAELLSEPNPGAPLSYDQQPTVVHAMDESGEYLLVDLSWELNVHQHSEGDPDQEPQGIADIMVALTSLYTLRPFDDDEPQDPYSEQELSAFAESSGKFALYPFVREAIHDLTGRLSLPPLTVPMLKVGLSPQAEPERSQLDA